MATISNVSLRWRHNDHAGVSNHQPHGCLLNRLFRCKSKKTSKLRVTGLCAGNSPGTGEFPAQMASYAENISIWWRHHVTTQGLISWMFWAVKQTLSDDLVDVYIRLGNGLMPPCWPRSMSSLVHNEFRSFINGFQLSNCFESFHKKIVMIPPFSVQNPKTSGQLIKRSDGQVIRDFNLRSHWFHVLHNPLVLMQNSTQ